MEKQKISRKVWFTVAAIFAMPVAIALIIVAAVKVLRPYAEECEYQGQTLAHLEKVLNDCNTCTCNNGTMSCTEMDCAAPVKSAAEALVLLKDTFKNIEPSFQEYPNIFGRVGFGKSTLVEDASDEWKGGWYIAFIEEDAYGTILSGSCFTIDAYADIGSLGEAVPETKEIDIKTCKEPVSEFTEEEALELVKNQLEVQEWLQSFVNNPEGRVFGTPSFGVEEKEDGFVIHAYESFADHNATFNWYKVTFDGDVTREF